jgi:ATP/maltotriose-dependent transcriptional regulator MalT
VSAYGEFLLSALRATVLLRLGRLGEASEILEHVVSATPPQAAGPRAAVVADLGAALAAAGEPERAALLLSEALQTARQGGAEDGVARVARVRSNQLASYSGLPTVKDLDVALETRA